MDHNKLWTILQEMGIPKHLSCLLRNLYAGQETTVRIRHGTVCLFEGTVVSMGRGTEAPFEIYGHPDMENRDFSFTPMPNRGSATPPHSGKLCYGVDLRTLADEVVWSEGVDLSYVVDAYHDLDLGDKFFTPMFEKLIGVGYVREMIIAGHSAEEIEAMWANDVEMFKRQRAKYLLYNE